MFVYFLFRELEPYVNKSATYRGGSVIYGLMMLFIGVFLSLDTYSGRLGTYMGLNMVT